MGYKRNSCLQVLELSLMVALIGLALVYIVPRLCRNIEGNSISSQVSGAYDYSSQIKSPEEMGAGSKGDYTTLSKDIKAMQGYIDVLVSGNSKAQRIDGPLGNKYFLDTGGSCTSSQTGADVQRYTYINNVPDGTIPLISGAMGTKFTQYEGLVPGILEDLGYIDPSVLFGAFSTGSTDCREITMPVRDNDNNTGVESNYVAESDISTFDACWFEQKINPVTGAKC